MSALMESRVLTALVLICSILATPELRDCDENNARVVMLVPGEFVSPVTCAMHGQAYLAETAMGRDLSKTDRIKVVCRPSRSIESPTTERIPEPSGQGPGHKQAEGAD